MDSEKSCFYAQALAEIAAGKIDAGLEAVAYVQSGCDWEKTKPLYITLRAEQLEIEAAAKDAARRERERMERMAEWNQHRIKVSRRSSSVVPSGRSSYRVRRSSYPGLTALLSWVSR